MKMNIEFHVGRKATLPVRRLDVGKVWFALPKTRLVCVQYFRGTGNARVLQSANIPNPQSNGALQVAMLQRHVAMSQIKDVLPVVEYAQRAD